MPERDRTPPLQSFGALCCLCTRPVHKDGMCVGHHEQFGPEAWKRVGVAIGERMDAAMRKPRGFALPPMSHTGPKSRRKQKTTPQSSGE